MTTPRTRRKPQERAADILRKELARLEAKSAQTRVAYETAQREETATRQAIAMLDQMPLPGLAKAIELAHAEAQDGLYRPPEPWPAIVMEPQVVIPSELQTTSGAPPGQRITGCPSCGGKRPWHHAGCSEAQAKVGK